LSRRAAGLAAAALLATGLLLSTSSHAISFEVCDRPKEPSADQRDVMLRFGAIVRDELVAAQRDVALIARSGLDLHRIDVRYSHEGVAIKDNNGAPWSVRELYYACEDHKPRVFDEGLAGFVMGTDDPDTSWISLVFLPPERAEPLRATAVDKHHALGVLGASYSANAYPFSTLHENCNQWVIELLADAWGPGDGGSDADARTRAQRWMRGQGYRPTVFTVSAHPMMWLGHLVPWLANDDHPPEELAHNRYNVSMPASIETFVRAKVPGASRVEICHAGRHVVLHRGWDDIADGCAAGPGDQTFELTAD
jgi:hypothetical protein